MAAIKLAIVGTGYIAKTHAQAAQALADVELVAVVNHRSESMAEFARQFGITRQYATVEDLLADGNVDALSINTPNYLHAPQSIAALTAGVHVMVEKPMAMNAAEAQAMLDASRITDAKLMVAHCWRFDEEVHWVKAQLDKVGDITRTKGYGVHVHWGPAGWFAQKELAGGGALADMGIHAIDTARFLLGDPQPVSVYADIQTLYGNYDVDDTGVIIVKWDNGTTSYIETGWWQPHMDGPEACTQLYGKKGFAQLFPTYLELPHQTEKKVDHIAGNFPFPRNPHCPQVMYDKQMAYFINCIKSDKTPVPGGIEGLINMRIVDAAYESSHSGKVVKW
jgi:predicted dehydrogenase